MANNYGVKCGLCVVAGVAIGVAGAMLLSRNPEAVKKGCTTLLKHAMDLKEKAATVMETAKENMADMAAEAKSAHEESKVYSGKETEV